MPIELEMDQNTKSKVVKGLKWTSIESLLTQILQFVISIVIARRLMPADYGILGMLAIFMGISQTFLDSGFGSALIQKKDINQADYSTAFYFNITIALTLYTILFFSAPCIAEFYKQPILVPVARVYMLSLVLNGLNIVQHSRFSRNMDFKTKAKISIISLLSSGIVGITMAYTGWGVWSLVWQGITSALVYTLLLWSWGHWIPSRVFSKTSFKALFGFGSKILCSAIINSIYSNISTLIIGKAFKATDLGLYTRARTFAALPGNTITGIVMKVNYPVLARFQDDNEQLMSNYKLLLRAPLFLLYPILFGMSCLAYPMIDVVLGAKWTGCVTMLIILCFGFLWTPLTVINLNLLYVKGRTDLVLKLELIKKPIAFLMLFSAIPLGIYGMCAAVSLYEFVAFSFNCYYTKKILGYGMLQQLKEITPIIGYGMFMAVCILALTWFIPIQGVKLGVGIPVGITSYIAIARYKHDVTLQSLIIRAQSMFPNSNILKKLAQ